MQSIVNADPQLFFVNATGLIQHIYGQPTPLSVPPNASYPAFTAPLPLGYPDYPSPKNAMRNYVIFKDCFHLSPASFGHFTSYHTRKFYHKALMDDQFILSSGGVSDGAVSSFGNVSSSLMVGTSAGESYSSILTFNTVQMPDTGVSAASIFLRRESLTGTNPIGSNMELKVISGNFGISVNVEPSDFQAPGDATGTPCQFGTSNTDDSWIRLEVPAGLLPYISQNALTQFMLSAPGANGMVTFTGAADPDFAPVINLTYGPKTTSLYEVTGLDSDKLQVYPNPATAALHITGINDAEIFSADIFDLPGKLVLRSQVSQHTVDISEVPSGIYLLKVTTVTGKVLTTKVIKK
jgi:hypothetical protein